MKLSMRILAVASFTLMLTSCFNGHKEEKVVEKREGLTFQ